MDGQQDALILTQGRKTGFLRNNAFQIDIARALSLHTQKAQVRTPLHWRRGWSYAEGPECESKVYGNSLAVRQDSRVP